MSSKTLTIYYKTELNKLPTEIPNIQGVKEAYERMLGSDILEIRDSSLPPPKTANKKSNAVTEVLIAKSKKQEAQIEELLKQLATLQNKQVTKGSAGVSVLTVPMDIAPQTGIEGLPPIPTFPKEGITKKQKATN